MRTSRVARETARLFENAAAASTPLRRSSRTSTLAARFSYNTSASSSANLTKVEESDGEDEDDVKLAFGSDIEDAITTTRAAKRRRTTATSAITTAETIQSSPARRTTRIKTERTITKSEPGSDSDFLSSLSDNEDIKSAIKEESKPTPRGRARKPARRVTSPSGTTTITPPSNWEEIYNLVKEMRLHGPAANAAVDTMGCERLADPSSTVKDRRFHTLVALMLSSQTRDTVNAEAMKRLHTELPPYQPGAPAGLNLDNMLHCPPAVLNELIGKVGFHNNKTKYLLQTAQILKDKFGGDIPPTIEGLVSLPGVGPKMAHLCMSAENGWNRVEGIGVDVHVHRITNYWGWNGNKETKTPEETRLALQSWLPREKWKEINWLLVGLGQSVCLPVGRRCGDCEVGLRGLCKAADRKKVNEGRRRREGVKKEEEEGVFKMEIKEDEEGGVVMKREQERVVKMEVVDEGMPGPPVEVQPEPEPQPDPESNVAIPSIEQDVKPVVKNEEEEVEMARGQVQSASVKNEAEDIDDDMVKKEEEDGVRMDQASHQPELIEDVDMEDAPEVKVEVKTEPRRRTRIPVTMPARDQSEDSESEASGAEVKAEVKTEPLRRARIPAHIPSRGGPEVKVEVKTEPMRRVRIPATIPVKRERARDQSSEDDSADDAEVKTEIKPEFIRQPRIPAHIPARSGPEVKVEVKTEPSISARTEVKREPDVKQEDS
ncbi:DNA glycosylase [Apiosordaria backusii]|uniref:Endonuclease III homolog n=1 Tax=Apiosordaria backusii TaxID=314023 RepID=A0AA40BK91_9PEZI|nr:DNA glycosylase [Apiosordaria backusii]